MNLKALMVFVALACSSGAFARCESTPKPIDDERSVDAATLVLRAGSTYYLLDDCITVSRSQFGGRLKLGYLNNFSPSVVPTFYSVKVKRTLKSDQRIFLSLVRSPGWYLALSPQSDMTELPEIRGEPYVGSLSQWNRAHSSAGSPDALRSLPGLLHPWHAYVDRNRSAASTDDIGFWQVKESDMKANYIITNYLIRFTPSQSVKLLDFDVYIQQGVDTVELETTSPIEGLSQTRTLQIVP